MGISPHRLRAAAQRRAPARGANGPVRTPQGVGPGVVYGSLLAAGFLAAAVCLARPVWAQLNQDARTSTEGTQFVRPPQTPEAPLPAPPAAPAAQAPQA
ncbi:MAG: hypothetical protein ACHQZQ_07810, partial [SAR324 cluster bacterium]